MTELKKIPDWTITGSRKRTSPRGIVDAALSVKDLSFSPYAAATNGGTSVIDLIGPIVVGEGCLIITGYQDFLSALSIIMEVRPGITHEPPASIRILFGTNTDNLRYHTGPRQPLPEHVRRHFMSQTGVFARDVRDLGAIRAIEAIKSGAIEVRVFDETRAEADLGRFPGMMHANLFINDEMAVAGSANFSRRGMASNIEFNDRVLAGAAAPGAECPHEARRRAGEAFWGWGRPWRDEATEILEHLLCCVDEQTAIRRIIEGMRDFQPWRPVSAAMGQAEEDLVYASSQSVYEHGFAWVNVPGGASRSLVGRAVAGIVADMYERTVMRDNNGAARRQGALALVSPVARDAWRKGLRGAMRIMPANPRSPGDRELREEMDVSAAVVLDNADSLVSRRLNPAASDSLLASISGGWTVGLASTRPDGLDLEAAAAFLEDAGALSIGHDAASEVARALSPLSVTRAGKRTKRSAVKVEEATRAALDAMSPFRCGAGSGVPGVQTSRLEVAATGTQSEALGRLNELVAKVAAEAKDADGENALGMSEDLRHIAAGVSISISALRATWKDGLGARLKTHAGGVAGGDQGVLPMFAAVDTGSSAKPVEEIEDVLFSRSLTGLDKSRAATILEASEGGILVLVETAGQARLLADETAMETGRPVYSFSLSGAPAETRTADVVAAGETVAQRARHLNGAAEFADAVADVLDARGIIFVPVIEAVSCSFRGFETVVSLAAPPTLGLACRVLGELEAGRVGRHVCVETIGCFGRADSKSRARAFREASMAGSAGQLGYELASCEELFKMIGAECGTADRKGGSLLDRLSNLSAQLSGVSEAATGTGRVAWGADYAVLEGAGESFTAFFLSGKSGGRSDIFMPPRLVVIRHGAEGDEIVRNQIAAIDMITRAHAASAAEGGELSMPRLDAPDLEEIGGHLAEITHWDIRPERVRVMAKSLAEFLEGRVLECDGESVLGDLTLPSLELLCERWSGHLAAVWRSEKAAARERWSKRGQVEDMIDLSRVEVALKSKPSWELDAVRAEMRELVEDLFFADRDRTKTIQDRVAVILKVGT